MSMQVIRHEVGMMLAEANLKIADATSLHANGTDREKVDAAGELTFLTRQRGMLHRRLAELDQHPHAPETVYQWVKEEVFNLNFHLESWIAHR